MKGLNSISGTNIADAVRGGAWKPGAIWDVGRLAVERLPFRVQMAVLLAAGLVVPVMIQDDFVVRLIGLSLIFAMLAIGLNIVTGIAGLLDLGYAAFFGVSAYYVAILGTGQLGGITVNVWWLYPGSVVMAGLAGLIVAIPAIRMRGDYLALTTLAFGEIAFLLFTNLDRPINITNGINGILSVPRPEIFGHTIGQSTEIWGRTFTGPTQMLYMNVAVFGIVVWYAWRLQYSRIGRAWNALRENEMAAVTLGVNRFRLKVLAFILGASTAGWAGSMLVIWQGAAFPANFMLFESIIILMIVVLGGRGSIPGVVLAAFLLTMTPEYLQFAAIYRHIIYGAVLLAVMIFRPQGLLGRQEYQARTDT